jgi:hypothetical protein
MMSGRLLSIQSARASTRLPTCLPNGVIQNLQTLPASEWGVDAEAPRQATRGEHRNRDALWRIKAKEEESVP